MKNLLYYMFFSLLLFSCFNKNSNTGNNIANTQTENHYYENGKNEYLNSENIFDNTQSIQIENQYNGMTELFIEKIKNGEIKKISELKYLDIDKYNIIIDYLAKTLDVYDEKYNIIDDYYITITIYAEINNERPFKCFTFDEYSIVKDLPEYKEYRIIEIHYGVFYYKDFLKENENTSGFIGGYDFTFIFFDNNEFYVERHK